MLLVDQVVLLGGMAFECHQASGRIRCDVGGRGTANRIPV